MALGGGQVIIEGRCQRNNYRRPDCSIDDRPPASLAVFTPLSSGESDSIIGHTSGGNRTTRNLSLIFNLE